jgi:hypothetical protein
MTADVLMGVQEPRFLHTPDNVVDNRAVEAIELMAAIGMPLDPWQRTVLEAWLGVTPDGSWAATSAGALVSRQNGKNSILEARELAGLFLFGERRIVHSAHSADTAREAYKRMVGLIESTPWLESEVRQMPKSPTAGIILKNGAELSYRTRTKGVRGFSAPVVVLDEAQELSGEQLAAIQPLISSFPRRQLLYTGTVLSTGTVFRGVVERGRKALSKTLGYAEWSAPDELDPHDEDEFVQGSLMSNPSIGFRITLDAVREEWETAVAALTEDKFLQERWSVWPKSGGVGSVITLDAWSAGETEWRPQFNVTGGSVGIAVSMDRSYAVVAYGLRCPDGVFVEAVAQTGDVDRSTGFVREGIDWVVPYVTELVSRRYPESVVVDKAGPAFPLVNGLIGAGVPVRVASFDDWKTSCAQFVDGLVAGRVKHSEQVTVQEAAQGVQKRAVGDAWVYDRKTPGVRVAPVEAVTLAAWGVTGTVSPPSKYETTDLLVLG